MEAEDRFGEKRAAILAESLDPNNRNKPAWGYFGCTGSLAIGDNSYAPKLVKLPPKDDDTGPMGNVTSRPLRKGAGPDVYFSFETPLALGDPYTDPYKRGGSNVVWMLKPDEKFRPPGNAKYNVNKLGGMDGEGWLYMEHKDTAKDPKETREKYRDYQPPKNIQTNAAKKGGGGVLTGGVLFGYPTGPQPTDKTDFPEHMVEHYDAPKELRKKELEEHRAKLQEMAFKGNDYGNRHFAENQATFSYQDAGPTHIPREKEEPDKTRRFAHEAQFRPSHPSKKGAFSGTFGFAKKLSGDGVSPFPEYMDDPVPGGASRKPPPEGDPVAPYKLGSTRSVTNPMPSVVTNMRNMRNERPSSFARPVL